jgi:methylated-DNA-[protein]-cysteine S-methyltransferase
MPALSQNTPLGPVTLIEENNALTRLDWSDGYTDKTDLLIEAHRQLAAYFAGEITEFDLPLAPQVSATQKRFLDALIAIPFGETKTYGQIAREVGMSAQGAGQACGANPIAIIIPCHRILGADSLGGFSAAGGVEAKVALLKHEGSASLLI